MRMLWQFGIFCCGSVYSPPPSFWYIAPRKVWQPCFKSVRLKKKIQVRVVENMLS
jgi:hypothetical protein